MTGMRSSTAHNPSLATQRAASRLPAPPGRPKPGTTPTVLPAGRRRPGRVWRDEATKPSMPSMHSMHSAAAGPPDSCSRRPRSGLGSAGGSRQSEAAWPAGWISAPASQPSGLQQAGQRARGGGRWWSAQAAPLAAGLGASTAWGQHSLGPARPAKPGTACGPAKAKPLAASEERQGKGGRERERERKRVVKREQPQANEGTGGRPAAGQASSWACSRAAAAPTSLRRCEAAWASAGRWGRAPAGAGKGGRQAVGSQSVRQAGAAGAEACTRWRLQPGGAGGMPTKASLSRAQCTHQLPRGLTGAAASSPWLSLSAILTKPPYCSGAKWGRQDGYYLQPADMVWSARWPTGWQGMAAAACCR